MAIRAITKRSRVETTTTATVKLPEKPHENLRTDQPNSAEGTKDSSKKKVEKSREVAESPTFIRQMSHIIEGAGDATPKPAKTERPAQPKLPKNQGTPNMYIPNCENVATQSSPSKVCSDVRNVVQETVPSEATAYTVNPRPIVNVDSNYVETHCQHGSKRPIYIHFRRKIQKPDGEVIRIHEVHINCARCPPPSILTFKEKKSLKKMTDTRAILQVPPHPRSSQVQVVQALILMINM